MAAKSKQDGTDSGNTARKAMPFEPRSTQAEKKSAKKPAAKPIVPSSVQLSSTNKTRPKAASGEIPEVVSRRMVKRIALFCGIPSLLGMSTFIVSYLVVSNGWAELPTYAVLLVSLGWFGLGVLGVSYGLLSASWDEDVPGSKLGIGEFKVNLGRMVAAWKENRQ